MIITFISLACGSEQERALLLAFIVSYIVDISLSHIVFIMIQGMIEKSSALLEPKSLCARNRLSLV